MRVSLPEISVVAFAVSILSVILVLITVRLQALLEPALANALQIIEALSGMLGALIGLATFIYGYFEELPAPPSIRDFNRMFPKLENDSPEILREKPHRVDFEKDYIVMPDNIGGLILKKIGVEAGSLFGIEINKEDANKNVRMALVAGPSGVGKTITALRFCFELIKFGWRTFYSDTSELFTVSTISEVRDWLCSLRKRNLIVLDNVHTNRNQLNSLLDAIENLREDDLLRLGTKIRVLCIETRAHAIESPKQDSNVTHIGGVRIATVPTIPNEPIGLGVTKTISPRPPGDFIRRIPTLVIERGEGVAKLLLNRFSEIVGMKPTLDFSKIFSETGSLIEFCEVLKWIRGNLDSDIQKLIPDSYPRVADVALERRLKVLDDRELGILTLGIIAPFSQVGSVVSSAFLESIIHKPLSATIGQLLNAQHLLEILVGPAQKQFLICTHVELARLLRYACAIVLQDFLSMDNDSRVDIKLYEMYLDYIKSLPSRSSMGIGSAFLLVLSSHAAIYQLDYIFDFVIEKIATWENPDANIKYSLYNVGQFHFKKGAFEKAEQIYGTILSIDDQFVEARGNYGALLFFQGKFKQATEQYEAAIKQKPNDPTLHANLSQSLWKQGDTSRALEEMKYAMDLASNVGRYKYNLGKMLFALGRDCEGLPYLRESIRLEPDDAEFYVELSHVLIGLDDIGEAEKVVLEGISRNTKSPLLLNNHGVILKKKGRIEDARIEFERALNLDPTFSLSLANLAEYYFLKNDLESAEEKTNSALKYDENRAELHALHGQILLRQRKYRESAEAFERAIELNLETSEIYVNLTIAYYELGEVSKSDDSMAKARQLSRTPNQLCVYLSRFYIFKFDFFRAKKSLMLETDLSKIKDIDPDYYDVLMKLAEGAMLKRDFTNAEWALEILLVVKSDSFMIWNNLGIVRSELGRLTEAKFAFSKAIEISPDNPGLWHNMANVLKKLGEMEESTKAYDRAKALGYQ